MLKGKKCLVVGSGISGIGAVTLLNRLNANIILFDGNEKMTIEELATKVPEGITAERSAAFAEATKISCSRIIQNHILSRCIKKVRYSQQRL